jgi:hypothetical protein
LAVLGLSFLAGSIPSSNIAARRRASVDLRDVGTGTVSGSALYRVAGFGPLALTGVADIAKAAVGPVLAGPTRPRLAALAGSAAIAGHNWSLRAVAGCPRRAGTMGDPGDARRSRRWARGFADRPRRVRGAVRARARPDAYARSGRDLDRGVRGCADVDEAARR